MEFLSIGCHASKFQQSIRRPILVGFCEQSYSFSRQRSQVGVIGLWILTFVDLTYAYLWHAAVLTMHGVDYSSAIIKLIAFVSHNRLY